MRAINYQMVSTRDGSLKGQAIDFINSWLLMSGLCRYTESALALFLKKQYLPGELSFNQIRLVDVLRTKYYYCDDLNKQVLLLLIVSRGMPMFYLLFNMYRYYMFVLRTYGLLNFICFLLFQNTLIFLLSIIEGPCSINTKNLIFNLNRGCTFFEQT